jgi:hypothetical protein
MKAFFIILLNLTALAYGQYKYPDYSVVYEKFYTQYSDHKDGKEVYIDFAKKEDGWYMKLSTPEDYMNKTYIPFWERKSNKWLPLDLDKSTGNFTPIDDSRIPYMFRVSPMYGYNGWYKDVIRSLGDQPTLSDTLLYALSKAYFSELAASFGNQYGDYIKEDVLCGTTVPNTFSNDDLVLIRKRYTKVAETNKRMQAQNPAFETFIGSLAMQYGNDVMDVFMRMYLYHNREEADKYLEKDLYDPYILDFSKYLLYSCPPNAILFTNGDNDTYPLWYVQYVLGIRTDVAVINTSLLNYPSYTSMIRKYGMVSFTAPEENLFKPGFEYSLVEDQEKRMNQLDVQNFLKQDFSGPGPAKISGGTFVFDLDDKEYLVKSRSYIYCGDLVMMDMIYTNRGKRPICFTGNADKFNGLVEDGLEYVQVKTAAVSGKEQALQLLKIWDKDFSLSDYSTFKGHFSESHNRLINSMVYDMAFKCKFLLEQGKRDEANAIVLKLDESYALDVLKRGTAWTYVASIYGKTGDKMRATIVMDQLIANESQEMRKDKKNDGTTLIRLKAIKAAILDGTFTF